MALNLNLGQVIKTNIASKFKKYVNNVGKQTLGIPDLSALGKINAKPSGGITNLAFPLDVMSAPGNGNHGHYVMFFVNEQTNAKLKFGNRGASGGASLEKQYGDVNGGGEFGSSHGIKSPEVLATHVNTNAIASNDAQASVGGKTATTFKKNVAVKVRPTRNKVAVISMFMPAQVQTTYGANYTDTQIGIFTGDAMNVFDQLTTDGGSQKSAMDSIKRIGTESLPTALTLMLQNTLGALPGLGGLREARGITTGEIISDRLELAFKGVNKRQFQYTFKMLPKSAAESEEIRNIVYMFKRNMLPEFVGGDLGGRKMVVPNTFDIEYMYNGSANEYLHKIGTCVLENMTVSYGGDKYRTYSPTDDGAPPVETTITLAFKEMDLITRENIVGGANIEGGH